ncbi:MAG: plastocyanin/azurin family copper-binding protein, partial [Bacteroidia bacterium]
IYRIVYKDAPVYKPITLSKENPRQLVNALKNDNLFWRMTAQRLLVERGDQDVLGDLYKLVKNTATDEIGLNGAAVHALWTIHGLGALSGNNDEANKVVIAALSHPGAGVRKAAAQVLPHTWWARTELAKSGLISDPDLHTRLAAFLVMSEMPEAEDVGSALFAATADTVNLNDPWLSNALYIAAHTHADGFLAAAEGQTVPPLVETFRQNHSGPKTEINAEGDFSGKKIFIKTIANQMKYDLKTFNVVAGEMVEISFENTDLLQHNLLILAPGSLEKVGAEADKLAQDPKGMEQGYIPKMKEVLHASGLADPKEIIRMRFKAPATPGDYPFVCTFPGHWRMMNGVMKVVQAPQ